MCTFSPIEQAIEDYRNAKMLIVVDDESRENEGDLIIAGERVSADAINFMARFGAWADLCFYHRGTST